MRTSDFVRATQSRNARIAASVSATRGQGVGAVHAARTFLCTLKLRPFGVRSAATFRAQLDAATDALRRTLPKKARSWGLARKLMNIFLRDALYTTYLCERFRLGDAENFFEVPLDSITASHLRRKAARGILPGWKGVKHLTPEASERYQEYAQHLAQARGVARVHLDTYWWGERAE